MLSDRERLDILSFRLRENQQQQDWLRLKYVEIYQEWYKVWIRVMGYDKEDRG